jgi:hypothetical protein
MIAHLHFFLYFQLYLFCGSFDIFILMYALGFSPLDTASQNQLETVLSQQILILGVYSERNLEYQDTEF